MMKVSYQRKSHYLIAAVTLCSVLIACGGGGSTSPTTGLVPPPPLTAVGSVVVQMGDAPIDNLVKFEITVVSVVLNPGNVAVLSKPVEVELTSLELSTDVIALATNVPAGNYTSITIQFSDPEIKFCPDPPTACTESTLQEVEPPLQNSTVTKNVSFSVVSGQAIGLLVDFDLRASIQTDAGGNITGVNPTLTCSVINVALEEDEFEAKGRVVSINRTSSTAGTFVLESFESCQQLTITVDANTEFSDFDEAGLANNFESLVVNQFVEVNADIQSVGTLLAQEVELEQQVELEQPEDDDEVEGIIISVTRDALGSVTEFTLVAHDVAPCSVPALTEDVITVTIDSTTDFEFDDDDIPVAVSLFDDASDLEIGQKVEVDPVGTLSANITAEEIELEEQTIRGTVDGAPTPPEFQLDPVLDLFPDQSITVQTFGETEFDGITGVSTLTSGQSVRVEGLLFKNGSELLLVAKEVDATP